MSMSMETARLTLHAWEECDAEALFHWAQDPQVGPSAGWPVHTSVENSREIIRTVLSAPDTFALRLKEDPEQGPIGSAGVFATDAPGGEGEPEIGYWIARPFWGQGLVPETVEHLLGWQFREKHAGRVWCAHFPGNDKSRRVIEKCGFTYICTGHEQLWPDGTSRPSLYYAITRREWEERHG